MELMEVRVWIIIRGEVRDESKVMKHSRLPLVDIEFIPDVGLEHLHFYNFNEDLDDFCVVEGVVKSSHVSAVHNV